MPTGYTSKVQSGEITEFSDFALQCARAFGALVHMRDDPISADVPDEVTPNDYHLNEADAAKLALEELNKLSDDDVIAACQSAYEKAVDFREQYIANKNADRSRYQEMLDKVKSWNVPTEEHQGLKDFMTSQLMDSIRFECSTDYLPEEPTLKTPTQWLNEQRERLVRDLAYHEKNYAEEVARCGKKTAWIRELKASLAAISEASLKSEAASPRSDEVGADCREGSLTPHD